MNRGLPGMVVGRSVQHEGVEEGECADGARELDELLALIDETAEAVGLHSFRMVGEEARHHGDRVRGDERSAAPGADVGPEHDGEQRLFATVEKVTEVTPVLVPAAGLGGRRRPGSVGTAAQVHDEGVGPLERVDCREVLGLDPYGLPGRCGPHRRPRRRWRPMPSAIHPSRALSFRGSSRRCPSATWRDPRDHIPGGPTPGRSIPLPCQDPGTRRPPRTPFPGNAQPGPRTGSSSATSSFWRPWNLLASYGAEKRY